MFGASRVIDLKKFLLKSSIVVLLTIGMIVCWGLYIGFNDADLEQPVNITIKRGDSLYATSLALERAGVISHSQSFRLFARFFGTGSGIKAGKYRFEPGETGFQVLQKIYRGYFAKNRIRVREGWTFRDLRNALDEHEAISHDTTNWSEQEIINRLEIQEKYLEGLFFPDTYVFSGGESDLELLRIAYEELNDIIAEEWMSRSSDAVVKTPYEALILASIIEKETSLDEEKPIVSGVFSNRLKKGMRLQADPTVIYGVRDEYKGDIRYKHLRDDNPYNTYTRSGLPPSPIALVSLSSIQAALNPAKTSALYFVAKGDGTHYFSDTLREHNRAVRKYQR